MEFALSVFGAIIGLATTGITFLVFTTTIGQLFKGAKEGSPEESDKPVSHFYVYGNPESGVSVSSDNAEIFPNDPGRKTISCSPELDNEPFFRKLFPRKRKGEDPWDF